MNLPSQHEDETASEYAERCESYADDARDRLLDEQMMDQDDERGRQKEQTL